MVSGCDASGLCMIYDGDVYVYVEKRGRKGNKRWKIMVGYVRWLFVERI